MPEQSSCDGCDDKANVEGYDYRNEHGLEVFQPDLLQSTYYSIWQHEHMRTSKLASWQATDQTEEQSSCLRKPPESKFQGCKLLLDISTTVGLSTAASQAIMAEYTESLEHCIRTRHSVRVYRPDEVDKQILEDCLRLAQLAPSNSNIQNWRLVFASGSARDRIASSLMNAATQADPSVPPLPPQFKAFRSEFGRQLYGPAGYDIPRGDTDRMVEARLRNYDFFGAPICGVITMEKSLTPVDAMSVGMFVQTFMLALTERGLGSCLEVSVTGYEQELRDGFEIAEDQMVLCGIAVGWPADHRVNELHTHRESIASEVRWLS